MISRLLWGLKNLIYPTNCLACKNKIDFNLETKFICAACWEKVERNLPPFCASCGRHLEEKDLSGNRCLSCLNKEFHFDRAFSPCIYTGTVKKLIHEFKYSQKIYLGKPLALLMHKFIRDFNLPLQYFDFIIPLPLHASRLRQREFNQAQILSAQVGKEFAIKVLTQVLLRTKATPTQTNLSFQERQENVRNSFTVIQPELIKDADILLIDDVLTTGATLDTAAKCLKEAGARMVIALTLAN